MAVAANIDVVEDHPEQVATDVLNRLLHSQEHRARQLAVLDNNHRQIHFRREHGSIRDTQNRRRIDQYQVKTILHIRNQFRHPAGVQNTRRIRRQNARGHEIKIVDRRLQNDVLQLQVGRQIVRQTHRVVDVKESVQFRTTQVRVDHQRVVPTLGADVRQIDQRRRLALTRSTRDNGDRVGISTLSVELNIRSQNPVRFRIRTDTALFVQDAHILRNDRQHRHPEIPFHIIQRLHTGVEILKEEGKSQTEDQAQDRTQSELQLSIRFGISHRLRGILVNGRRFPRHQIDDPSPLLLVDHLVQDFLSGAVLVFRLLILGVFAAIQNAGVLLLFGNVLDVFENLFRHANFVLESVAKLLHALFQLSLLHGHPCFEGDDIRMVFTEATRFHHGRGTLILKELSINGGCLWIEQIQVSGCTDQGFTLFVFDRLQLGFEIIDLRLFVQRHALSFHEERVRAAV